MKASVQDRGRLEEEIGCLVDQLKGMEAKKIVLFDEARPARELTRTLCEQLEALEEVIPA